MNSAKYILRMLNPFGYNKGDGLKNLKKELSDIYSNENVFILKNGRDALYLFLKSLGLSSNSLVAVQAFTCNAVINPILWNNLNPLYIDISPENFSMSIKDLERKLVPEVKVLILQHTFGLPADLDIISLCRTKGIIVIEDCAHTLGNSKLGVLGDATILSFGFEKMLSTRVGGALIVNNLMFLDSVNKEYKNVKTLSKKETFLWLLNPVLWRILRRLPENLSFVFAKIFNKIGLLNRGFKSSENLGILKSFIPKGLSVVLAGQTFDCLTAINSNMQHRISISNIYSSKLNEKLSGPLVRYPFVCSSREEADLKIEKISKLGYPMFDKWYFPVVFPRQTDLSAMKYTKGSCPMAENISEKIINLPTHQGVNNESALKILEIVLGK